MRIAVFAAVVSLGMTAANAADRVSDPPLLPRPTQIAAGTGAFSFAGAHISASEKGERAAADRLRGLLVRSGGPELGLGRGGQIRFRHDPAIAGGGSYRIAVTPAAIDVAASSDAGLYYGAETLWQLMDASGAGRRVDALTIDDGPAFTWRGIMLDSARHMQPVAYIKQLIDRMAMAKLNVLHWHLTDDQGWRIQIDRYPRLTSVGAWRQEAGAAGTDGRTGRPIVYGGFYTKAEIREIVAFARTRHVTIVPEIDMPGHATAIVASYPALASTPTPPTNPSHDWGILPNLLNPADSTFTFVEKVLDEVMALFPGPFIHVGGDEAVKDQWRANPAIQAQIKALGLKDEDALQGWFTARVGAYLTKHGRRMIGWDEIQQGKIPADAAVMSWHGIDGAVAAARAGHDAILAASPILYLDHIQSPSAEEPPGRAEIVDWRTLYGFEPAPAELRPEERPHVLGLQANLWTEHARTTDYADRMIWPRAAIVAELGWSSQKKDWPGFSRRLVAEMRRWDRMGIGYDATPLEPQAAFSGSDRGISVALRQQAAMGTLHYSTDGTPPSPRSPVYDKPLNLRPGTALMARAFAGGLPIGKSRRWVIGADLLRTRSASEMELCTNAIQLRLEDDGPTAGVRKVHWVDIMHPCWIWRAAALEGASRIVAEVGRLPFNFSIGDDIHKISFEPPVTAAGELHVRRDACDGPIIATIPLQPATQTAGVAEVTGRLSAQSGAHDLCMTFSQTGPDPFWVLERLTVQ